MTVVRASYSKDQTCDQFHAIFRRKMVKDDGRRLSNVKHDEAVEYLKLD